MNRDANPEGGHQTSLGGVSSSSSHIFVLPGREEEDLGAILGYFLGGRECDAAIDFPR